MSEGGGGTIAWVIAAIVVLMLAGLVATIVISEVHEVRSGYIPPEARGDAGLAPDRD